MNHSTEAPRDVPGAVETNDSRTHTRGGTRTRRTLAAAGLLAVLALPASAQAAGPPKANTGSARDVSYGSATLLGSVNPSSSSTSYYFQYGPTKAYGGQSAIASAGAGNGAVPARLTISGLQPLTVYHYRLVAVNAAGVAIGDDNTLRTTKVPLSLAILATPNPVPFGGTVTVQGTLSGTGNASRAVVLQASGPPFTTGYQNIGNPELTTATGSFSFSVPALTQTSAFRVVTVGAGPIVSPVAIESVAVRVSSHVSRTKRAGYARIYGTVTPAVDGMQVGVLRIVGGHGVLVGGTVLHHNNTTSSKFSRIVRVHKGVYRVLARVVNLGVVSAYGSPLVIR